jgi:HEAT repeat protein
MYAGQVAAMAGDGRADAEIRLLAVNALARLRDAAACDALIKVVDGGRTFFGRQKIAAKTPVVLAALRALAHTWSDEPRASAFLKRGLQSPDADVRQASQPNPS